MLSQRLLSPRVLILNPLLLVLLFAVACGGASAPEAIPTKPAAGVLPVATPAPAPTSAQVAVAKRGGTLRTVSQASIKSLDRNWTTAFVTFVTTMHFQETLFGRDAKDNIQPVMIKEWKVSPDNKVWTFVLRDGLIFHDGTPVTSNDVIASINRWKQKSSSAKLMFKRVEGMDAVDATTFTLRLKEPFGVLEAFANYVYYLPIIPARLAATSPDEQIKEYIGSGPYKFASWEPGNRLVLERFDGYKPRSESASFLAGARIAYLDKIEYLEIPDAATKLSGLETGQWDFVDGASQDDYNRLKANSNIQIFLHKPGHTPVIVFNTLRPPFDNIKARQAVAAAVDAGAIMATYGAKELWQLCPAIFYCDGIWETNVGKEFYNQKNIEKGKQLLKESGYAGEPVLLMGPTDYSTIYPIAQVGKVAMEAIGLKLDFPAMDWATLVAKRAQKDAWHILTTWCAYWACYDPIVQPFVAGGWFGWYDSPRMQELVEKFAVAPTQADKRAVIDQVQLLAYEEVPYVHLGQFYSFDAARAWLKGYHATHFPVYWGVWLER